MNMREFVRALSVLVMFFLISTVAPAIAGDSLTPVVPAEAKAAAVTGGEPAKLTADAPKEAIKDIATDDQNCRRKMSDPYWHVYCYYRSSQSPAASDDIDRLQYDLGHWVIFEKFDQDKDFPCQKLGVCAHTPSGVITHPGIKEENNSWDSWRDEPLTYDNLWRRLRDDVTDFYNRYPNGY
jgi:hypothetical protein